MRKAKRLPSRARRRALTRAPVTATALYGRWLRQLFDQLAGVVNDRLTDDVLWHVAATDDSDTLIRRDAVPAQVTQAIGDIQLRFAEILDPRGKVMRKASETAASVDKLSKAQFKKLSGKQAIAPDVVRQNQFIDRNVQLIQSIADKQLGKVQKVIEESARVGMHVREIRQQIMTEFEVSKERADLIARDQILKMHGELTKDRQQSAGATQYIWTTSGDERVRDWHDDLDGTLQSWDNPPQVSPDGRHEHPGQDYQCRCTAFPVFDELGGAEFSEAF